MKIKNLKPDKKSKFKQNYYDVSKSVKYKGKLPVIYRSSWEKRFMDWCERNPLVELWSSESIEIPYFNPLDSKTHTYNPDFLIKLTNGKIIVVEVKPSNQLTPPRMPSKKTTKSMENYNWLKNEYIKNMLKKKEAERVCENRGWKFNFVTEKWFNI